MERLTNSDKEIPTLIDNAEYWLQAYFKLKDYEDAEEQGLLLRLPCKVGDTAWYVDDDDDKYPIEIRITKIEIKENYILYFAEEKEDCGTFGFIGNDFGETIFRTQAEAEQKLKEIENYNIGE